MVTSLFQPVVPDEKCDPGFLHVRNHRSYTAARRILDEVFQRSGGTLAVVKDFQSIGFSARIWELALFAYAQDEDLKLVRSDAAPDLVVTDPHRLAIEATTSNPPGQHSAPPDATSLRQSGLLALAPADTTEDAKAFVFQIGKALRRKLLKRDASGAAYWEQAHVAGFPFLLAIQAFHSQHSLFHSVGVIAEYLYGRRDVATRDDTGRLILTPEPIEYHELGGRRIPSNFFGQPEAREVDAVIFSNSATVSIFNRIGVQRGYGDGATVLVRTGFAADVDPNADVPALFGYIVEPGMSETFADSLHVFHNPGAIRPVAGDALPHAARHELQPSGLVLTTARGPSVLQSTTASFTGRGAAQTAREYLTSWRAVAAELGAVYLD